MLDEYLDWIKNNKSRFLSLIFTIFYIAIGFLSFKRTGGQSIYIIVFPFPCLLLIWFGDAIGGMTGIWTQGGRYLDESSPGWAVAFMGWVILLLPFIFAFLKIIKLI